MLRAGKALSAFRQKEDGTVTIYSTMTLVTILAITGASVDIMYHEAERARLQTTLDRAVLAAADLEQMQSPEDVVNDYITRAGLGDHLESIDTDSGLNARTVSAEAALSFDTIFMQMMGYDTLDVSARATAEERISNVEISMVLDVSGSMGGDKIENLRAAASEFVDTVVQPPSGEIAGLTTVSVVPYNAVVNLGDVVGPYYNLDRFHDYSSCALFDDDAFTDTAVRRTDALGRLAHFDLYSDNENTTEITRPWCPEGQQSAVIVHSNDTDALTNHVQSFGAGGNTAIDLGMKWGVALLSPQARDLVSQMAQDGHISSEAADRPADYDDPEAIKFVVVMTDGENTTQFDLKPQYRTGYSDVWIDDRGTAGKSDDRFSLLVEDNPGSGNDRWFWHRFENGNWWDRNRSTPDGGANARRMTNPELFARFGTRAVARKLYVQPYYDGFVTYDEYFDIFYAYEGIVGPGQADDRLSDICTAAKDSGIIVFAIAFEAPPAGQAALADCASSASHYFDVAGVEITETFHAIARQINALRLIQ